jgi:translation initiation factor eIF-2B subunit delta
MFEHKKLRNGDIILTHAFSSVVLDLFCTAWKKGIEFEVIVCDSRPKMEGRELLKRLTEAGIPCTYILSQALPVVMKKVTKVIMGASSIFSNGAVMSRVGTAVVATLAHYYRVPVIILCQAYKFSDAVRLDSFVWNEIGNPDEIVDIRALGPSNKRPRILSPNEPLTGPLSTWRDIQSLKILNIHYDVTPAKFVTMVCCDHGCIPPTACLSVLREIQSTK